MIDRFYRWSWKTLHRINGDSPMPFAQRLNAQQWQSADEVRSWQQARLMELLQHAHDRIPFYRERIERAWSGRPSGHFSEACWRQLPLLAKEELRAEGKNLVANNGKGLICSTTSGSTGAPVTVWRELEFMGETRAIQQRALNWFGVEPWSRAFVFGALPRIRSRYIRQRVINALTGRMAYDSFDLSPERLRSLLLLIRRRRPAIVGGYTNAVYQLARAASEFGIRMDDIGIKIVMPVSEQTEPYHAELFEQVFGAPVFVEYGCVEVGAMAYRCPSGRLHISHEHCLLEVVDQSGAPAPDGSVGRVVLTPLLAKAMPLLRYDIGDLATLTHDSCPCGRHPGMPSIERIAGRSMDIVVGRTGRPWHGNVFYYALKNVFDSRYFKEFQGVQTEPGKVELLIVPGSEFHASFADRFAAMAMEMMEHDVDVAWRIVDHIEREGSGKLKYFRSLLPKELREGASEATVVR